MININKNILNSKILIWGYGLEGKSALKFLISRGKKDNIIIATSNGNIDQNIEGVLIINENDILNYDFDIVIKSSGVSFYKKEIQLLIEKGIIITSTLNILLSEIINNNKKIKVIGITGTKGKSTTSSILYYILNNLGYKTALLGNIGISFLDVIDKLDDYQYLVLELSSYQVKTLNYNLDYSLLLNLFPEHIDWHITHENYFKDKINILKHAKKAIFNASDTTIQQYIKDIKNNYIEYGNNKNFYVKNNYIMYFDKKIININSIINIKGEHIFKNICGLLCILKEENIDINKALNILLSFKTLNHRLDIFYNNKINNIEFIDDSISTIPEATIEAVKTFNKNDTFLILGGYDRQQDYTKLIEAIKNNNKIKKIFLLGQTGKRLENQLNNCNINCHYYNSLKELTDSIIINNNTKNITVLLSPASASYDMFKNFEERGDIFKELMLEKISIIVDEDIKLKVKTYNYIQDITNLVNKNKINFKKTLSWLPDEEYTLNDAKKYIKNTTYNNNQDFVKDFIIEYQGKVVGTIDLQGANKNEIDIGYWLDKDYEGKGIVTKSCKKLIDYTFKNSTFNKINIFCGIENIKSENIAKRLNMKFECIVKNKENLYGKFIDNKKYYILKK